ncbi:type VI secretion system Vgr family protein [Polyangium aurulentum]|uniref:type VI secretion system Vgr family protein n=1 Tax=Polyangium aurulentum TaxID=2567896 RepID=UPI0010AE1B56|nr:type VI secretion system tip protein TssI/VgrG [Polyangium aurulentum]UQA56917.1 type VI secretion system tip protein VgrG [Polyangium aurulentum]
MEEVRHISFVVTTLGELELEVSQVTGREAISQLFEYEVLASYRQQGAGGITAEELLGQEAVLLLHRSRNGSLEVVRRVHGLIAEVNDRLETQADFSSFRMRFVPRAYRLSLMEQQDVLLDVDLPTLLRQKLDAAAFKGDDYQIRLFGKYPVRELVVQYRETDLAFISRQCEHFGVSFFFEHEDGRDVMVFTDRNEAFPEIQGKTALPYRPRGEHHEVYRFEENLRMIPAQYVVRDYNYRNPQMDVTGQAMFDEGKGTVIEYGTHVKTPDEADMLAQVRAEERIASRRRFEGTTDIERLAAGRRFVLSEHPMGDVRLLVTEMRIEAALSAYGAGIAQSDALRFECHFQAIREATRHRPARLTPRPRIYGVINAVVEAEEKGQYAEVDDQGRYLVKFMFDTQTPDGRRASRYVRMAQPHTGAGYGIHFPLRAGIEVLISFVDGDPDRPIITAAVPNPQTASPVVRDNRTRNVVRTGGGNEINFDDKSDGQRVKIHSPYASTTFQLGAPNSPESGAVLETWGASSQVAFSGVSSMSAWNALLTMAKTELASGNVISDAGGGPAKASEYALWGIELGVNSIGGMAETALKVVEIMRKEEERKIAKEKAKKIKAEAAYRKELEKRVAQIMAEAPPGTDERLVVARVEADIGAKTKALRDEYTLGGLPQNPNDPNSKRPGDVITAHLSDPRAEPSPELLALEAEYASALADIASGDPARAGAAEATFVRMGDLAKTFFQANFPVNKTADYGSVKTKEADQTAAKAALEQKGKDYAKADKDADAARNDALVMAKYELDLASAEYSRKEFELQQGEYARNLKQADHTLNAIKKATDLATTVTGLYSTVTGILGLLGEQGGVKKAREAWDKASDLLHDSNHREEEGFYVLGATMSDFAGSMSGFGKALAVVGAGLTGPAGALAAKLAIDKMNKAAALKAGAAKAKAITANSPEPVFNIQSSSGTAALIGKNAALVSSQATVLLGQVAEEEEEDEDELGLMDKVQGFFGKGKAAAKKKDKKKKDKEKKDKALADSLGKMARSVLDNKGTVAVVGEKQAFVTSPETVEIAGDQRVAVTSSKHVDVLGEEQIDVLAGARQSPGWGMKVDATTRNVTYGNVTGEWKGEITAQGIHLGAQRRSMGLESKLQSTTVSHGRTSVELDGTSMTLKSTRIEHTANLISVNGKRVMIG